MGLFSRDKGEEVVVGIEGMSCMHCVGKVEKSLKGLEGVLAVSVDLEKKQATVSYDPAKVSVDGIREKIVEAGYKAV